MKDNFYGKQVDRQLIVTSIDKAFGNNTLSQEIDLYEYYCRSLKI